MCFAFVRKKYKMDYLIKKELDVFSSQEETTSTSISPLENIQSVLSRVEVTLKEHYPENSPIEFGSLELGGVIPISKVSNLYEKHKTLVHEDFLEKLGEILEEDFPLI
jgi:hypothetical protein